MSPWRLLAARRPDAVHMGAELPDQRGGGASSADPRGSVGTRKHLSQVLKGG